MTVLTKLRLKVYYQNVRGLRTKTDAFFRSISMSDYDVILLCETWLHEHILDGELFDDRYIVYRNDRDSLMTKKSRGGGCLIAVKKSIHSRRVEGFEIGHEDIWVAINHVNGSKTFFNVKYIDCGSRVADYKVHLDKLCDIMNGEDLDCKFILCGDYNLHGSVTWVTSDDDKRVCVATNLEGDIANSIVEMQSLTSLNQFNCIKNSNNRSLDLVFSNVETECIEDGHHPALSVTVNTTPVRYINEKRSSKPNFFRADYLELSAKLILINWVSLFYSLNVNDCLKKFNAILMSLINELPKSTGKNRQFPCWYSKELISLIGKKSKAKKKKKSGALHSLILNRLGERIRYPLT